MQGLKAENRRNEKKANKSPVQGEWPVVIKEKSIEPEQQNEPKMLPQKGKKVQTRSREWKGEVLLFFLLSSHILFRDAEIMRQKQLAKQEGGAGGQAATTNKK